MHQTTKIDRKNIQISRDFSMKRVDGSGMRSFQLQSNQWALARELRFNLFL